MAIPIIVHLLNRKRYRTTEWAAMPFLLKAARESRGKKKLKHWVILATRTLLIAALVFAISRPLIGRFFAWGNGGRVEHVLFILDHSASMEKLALNRTQSLRATAITQIQETAEKIGAQHFSLLDSAHGQITPLTSVSALDKLPLTAPTEHHSHFPTLLEKALTHLEQNPGEKTEIWIATDLQRSDWSVESPVWETIRQRLDTLPSPPQIRILSLKGTPELNQSIQIERVQRLSDKLLIDCFIQRNQENEIALALSIGSQGGEYSESIQVSGLEYRFQLKVPLPEGSLNGYGWVRLPNDTNLNDNLVYYTYGPPQPTQIWLISDKDAQSEDNQTLLRAAAPLGIPQLKASFTSPETLLSVDWQSASLVIWDAPLPQQQEVTDVLTAYLKAGGNLLFIAPEETKTQAFLGVSWGNLTPAPDGEYFLIDKWNQQEGPLRNSPGGGVIPVDFLKTIQKRELSGNATTLASWEDSSPLLSRVLTERGGCYFLGTRPNLYWSNLDQMGLHLVLIQRLANSGKNRFTADYSKTVGQAAPSLKTFIRPPDLPLIHDPRYHSGIVERSERFIAINRAKEEDLWEKASEEEIQLLIGKGHTHLLSEGPARSDNLVTELWKSFLILALIFIVVESVLTLQKPLTKK